jgi:hypothetical protein
MSRPNEGTFHQRGERGEYYGPPNRDAMIGCLAMVVIVVICLLLIGSLVFWLYRRMA